MTDEGGSNNQRGRARSGRGTGVSDRTGSSLRQPRDRSTSLTRSRHSGPESSSDHHGDSGRHHHQSRDRRDDRGRREHKTHRDHRDYREREDRGGQRTKDHDLIDASRQTSQKQDLIPRFRDKAHHSEPETKSTTRGRTTDATSPSSTKRHRSRSDSPSHSQRKKSRKYDSSSSYDREYSSRYESKQHRHHSPSNERKRHRSPESNTHSRRSHLSGPADEGYTTKDRGSSSKSPASRHRSSRETTEARERSKLGHRGDPSGSRSPLSERHSQSSHRPHSPSNADTSDARGGAHRKHISSRHGPPKSPQTSRERRHQDDSIEAHYSSRSDLNDDIASRGGLRAGYKTTHAPKQHRSRDSRSHSTSPQRSGYYRETVSPWDQAHGDRNGQYSPPHKYHSQSYSNGGSFDSQGASRHSYHSTAPRSPPYGSHTNSMRNQPLGSHRGSRADGFRGGSFSAVQSYYHRTPDFKGSQRNSGAHTESFRGHISSEDSDARRHNGSRALDESNKGNGNVDFGNQHSLSSKDQSSDSPMQDALYEEGVKKTPTSLKAPSAGAQAASSGPKFSFAFKASSKPTPTAPKLEISQKFNAVPQKKDALQGDNIDRAPPRSAPTEPASARHRSEFSGPPDGPKLAPRMRKVKKKIKKMKARPCLSPDHVEAGSVFFRKPGNESVVGSGTYGKVFKGVNVYTKGLVALKRIRMEGEKDGFPVTAVREIKLLQSLRHLNIVNLQEVMVEKNDCFMVFEYLSHDLTGLLHHPNFHLDPAQRKHLAKQLFEGLDYLHVRGVLHRDIKAANILVSNEGILKLADFGLARFYAKRHQLDYTNRVITIWYRSPELLLGETQYNAAVDVWSAACVMLEIFTKAPIFPGDGTELSQIDKIYSVMGTPSRQDWPGLVNMAWFELLRPSVKRKSQFAEKYQDKLTPAAFELLEAMLCYDPEKRPTAAEALQHRYFTTEEPLPKQAVELSTIDGEWHEFESKALRKENERKDREARRAARDNGRDKDRKPPTSSNGRDREAKRALLHDTAPNDNQADMVVQAAQDV